jgi:hypothetical protein
LCRKQGFHTLEFDNHRVFNEKIKSVAGVKMQIVIDNGKCDLCLNSQTGLL